MSMIKLILGERGVQNPRRNLVNYVQDYTLTPKGARGGYSHCGLTGGSSQFEGLTNWLPNGPFVNHILPIRGILRFVAIYYVSTRYAPPHANLVITGSIINESLKISCFDPSVLQ